MSDITVTSNAPSVLKDVEKAMQQAATMIGGTVEGHAKELCPVDTGLLRNSITYALGGESPAVSVYYDNKMEKVGEYEGSAPDDEEHEVTVYIGTNVHYAPYNELGTVKMTARPFLRPAMENNKREIEQILKMCFEGLK